MSDKVELEVDLLDDSYKSPRNIYKIVVCVDDNSTDVNILAYYKTNSSKNKDYCYYLDEKDKFRFKSSYETFIVPGLTEAINSLKQLKDSK